MKCPKCGKLDCAESPCARCGQYLQFGPITAKGWVAVRQTEGKLWIEIGSVRLTPEEVHSHCAEVARNIPGWGKANPVSFIREVEITTTP
jgi:hypothetical protein